jgi:hypothetical protein
MRVCEGASREIGKVTVTVPAGQTALVLFARW